MKIPKKCPENPMKTSLGTILLGSSFTPFIRMKIAQVSAASIPPERYVVFDFCRIWLDLHRPVCSSSVTNNQHRDRDHRSHHVQKGGDAAG